MSDTSGLNETPLDRSASSDARSDDIDLFAKIQEMEVAAALAGGGGGGVATASATETAEVASADDLSADAVEELRVMLSDFQQRHPSAMSSVDHSEELTPAGDHAARRAADQALLERLSAKLTQPLKRVGSRQWINDAIAAGLQWATLSSVVVLGGSLVLGIRPGISEGAALLLTTAVAAAVAGVAVKCVWPLFKRKDLFAAARQVDEAIPEFEERIESALSLLRAEEEHPELAGSPELIAALVREAEEAAAVIQPGAVVSAHLLFKWVLSGAVVLALWIGVGLFIPSVGNGILRLAHPLRPVTLAAAAPEETITVVPGNVTLAEGEPLTVTCELPKPLSKKAKLPDRASLVRQFDGGGKDSVSVDMQRTGESEFRASLEGSPQSFTYWVTTGDINAGGLESAHFRAQVQAKPLLTDITLIYHYPTYTGLGDRTLHSRDGAIDALIGTRVDIVMTPSEIVKAATLTVGDGAPVACTALPTEAASPIGRFSGSLTIKESGNYRISLTNAKNQAGNDTQGRPIVARLDNPPEVTIVSPTETMLRVRPSEMVPVTFRALDDFGVMRIEVVVKVDDQPEMVIPVPNTTATGTGDKVKEASFRIPVGEILRNTLNAKNPKRLTYQVRAWDNRPPSGQAGISPVKTLVLDTAAEPLAQREGARAAKEIGEGLQKADEALSDAERMLEGIKATAGNAPLSEDAKRQAGDARQSLTEAQQRLAGVASAANSSGERRWGKVADQAKQISSGPVQSADTAAAQAQVADGSEEGGAAKQLAAAEDQVKAARQAVAQLRKAVGVGAKDGAHQEELAGDLDDLAAKQRRLADQLALHPNDPALIAQQKELQKQVEDVIAKNHSLQEPGEKAHAAEAAEMQKTVQNIAKAQDPLKEVADAQRDAANAAQKSLDLSDQQAKTNRELQQFLQEQGANVDKATGKSGAANEAKNLTESAPGDLQTGRFSNAAQKQAASASQLEQVAESMEAAAKRAAAVNSSGSGERDAVAARQKEAAGFQQSADNVRKQIDAAKAAHDPPTRPSDPANQSAQQAAEQLRRSASRMNYGSQEQRTAATDAAKEATAAQQAAQRGNADEAQQHLQSAANRLADAARASGGNSNQNNPPSPEDAKQMAAAAAKARELAQKQRDLAQQTAALDQHTKQVRGGDMGRAAEQQHQVAQQMQQAAKQARDAQEKAQGSAPDMARQLGEAAKQLDDGAQSQESAAQATRKGDSREAAEQQQAAQSAMDKAKSAIAKATGASGQSGKSGGSFGSQGGDSGGSDGSANTGKSSAKSSNSSSPGSGRTASSGSGSPGGSSSSSGATASSSGSGSGGTPGSAGSGGTPGSPQNSSGSAGSSGGSSSGGTQSLAEAVQAARAAQDQAAAGDPAAARQAADQLTKASRQAGGGDGLISGGGQGGSSGNSPSSGGDSSVASGSGQGSSSGNSSGGSGSGTGSSSGSVSGGGTGQGGTPGSDNGGGPGGGKATATPNLGNLPPLPTAVKDIGVAPSDWARLSPGLQEELLNAAQQNGPPGYREMIKSYYSKLAQRSGGEEK